MKKEEIEKDNNCDSSKMDELMQRHLNSVFHIKDTNAEEDEDRLTDIERVNNYFSALDSWRKFRQ